MYALIYEVASICATCTMAKDCRLDHVKPTERRLYKKACSTRLGPIHSALASLRRDNDLYTSEAQAAGIGWTGWFEIMVIDTDKLQPLWSPAEHAAYKLGGLEGVQRLQKGLAVEKRAIERARVRAEKAANKPARARQKRLDKALGIT